MDFSPLIAVTLTLLLCSTVFGVAYLYFTARTRERLALIARGMDPNTFRPRRTNLKFGMLVSSVVLGTLLGDLIGRQPFGYPIGVPLAAFLGGISLIVYYFIIDKRLNSRDKANGIDNDSIN
ncbi:DUF6249 domain-containing protein [Hymenobacter sp. YC55]|uniref:DUF6249 domain-containing protein n=1 Tax=Hymenobacter sp. YC55 TaxID=3034019 RepID=UPI0023F781A6|nr:DUF6249 domain-containing protein [Hymenobacter sp. YC55]MDF7814740.1 hypothetical protein [Hymenobacter sp. YC55]